MNTSAFPGATAVTHLRVYDWESPDGQRGGSPHLHTVSAEGYVVLGGTGALETLGAHGYARTELERGTLLWFTPGTVHRLVNTGGDLEILVIMQNAGLPEAGDAVLTFPEDVLADPARYAAASALPATAPGSPPDGPDSPTARAARRRRDLAVEGYLALRARILAEGPQALRPLHEAAARLVAPRAKDWRTLWQHGAAQESRRTSIELTRLADGADAAHLSHGTLHAAPRTAGPPRYGMCGRLETWNLGAARAYPLPLT
ncbi:cupin domain-containing protein [Streptomyces sp. E11-3]|uniref:cupin domain-containing protein n=1 Tax=Streptomyces sp. E11-3 TaxID=3110112 RepID=UPI003980D4E6